jgi:hypothetical protein
VVESLSNKHEALSSIPSLEGRKKEKKKKEGGKEGRREGRNLVIEKLGDLPKESTGRRQNQNSYPESGTKTLSTALYCFSI